MMSKMELDAFDTYATSKGYDYNSTKKMFGFTKTTYTYNYNEDYGAEYWLSHYQHDDNFSTFKYSVGYQTLNKNDYLKIKTAIIKNGYKLINSSTTDDGALEFIYKKGKSEVDLSSKISSSGNGSVYFIDYSQYK